MKLVTYDDGKVGRIDGDEIVRLDVPTMRGYFERHCTENEDVVWRRMAERLAGLGWIDVKPAEIAPGLYMIEKDGELCIRRRRDGLWYRQQTGGAEVLDCPSEPYRARRIRLDE